MLEVEIDKMVGLVRYIGTEIPPDNAMPTRRVFLVELFFYVDRYVLRDLLVLMRSAYFFDLESPQSLVGHLERVLLHVFVHVRALDDWLVDLRLSHFHRHFRRNKVRLKKMKK